ncbi:MAG: hypothetical protein ACRC7O_16250, partial [Fimbriiglobus sp.]
ETLKLLLEQAELPDDLTEAIEKDIDELAGSLARDVPKPGAAVGVSLRTPRGWESCAFDPTTPTGPAPKPLTVLKHFGGRPLLAFAGRSGTTADDFRTVVKWVEKAAGHLEKVAILKTPDNPKAEEAVAMYRKFVPLIREFAEITEKLWFPALADGQLAVVIDAKWASKQWHAAAPAADEPLPLLEAAGVLGVSDAAKFEKAVKSYRAWLNKVFLKAHEEAPEDKDVPLFELVAPDVDRAGKRTFASYPIPPVGLDEQVKPTAGLSDAFAVLALSRGHADRLLTPTPLTTPAAPLADPTRPVSSAFVLDFGVLVDALRPWVGFGRGFAGDRIEIATQVLDIVGVFRGYTAVTYREGAMTVTHSEAVFRDLPAGGK